MSLVSLQVEARLGHSLSPVLNRRHQPPVLRRLQPEVVSLVSVLISSLSTTARDLLAVDIEQAEPFRLWCFDSLLFIQFASFSFIIYT